MKLKKIHWSSLAVIVMINPVLLLWKIVYAKVASSHGLVVITAPVAQLIVKQTIM